jgi:hypothetical protein
VRPSKPSYLQLAAGCGWVNLIGAAVLLLGAIKEGPGPLIAAFLGFGAAGLIFCGCAVAVRLDQGRHAEPGPAPDRGRG